MSLTKGSPLSFAKLVMMSSAPAKSAEDARYASQDPFIRCPIKSRLQTQLRVHSFWVERNNPLGGWYIKRWDIIPEAERLSEKN